MRETLKTTLKPIYNEMITTIQSEKDLYTFCLQWGKNFSSNNGILYVGKATNGWISKSKDIEKLFGNDKKQIFDRKDQMEWVENLNGNTKGYNTNKSAFWRVIIKTSQNVFNENNVISKIAWSNLYKISYEKGNPDQELKKKQKEYCKRILKEEIEILSPKYVVFLTSHWEKVFLKYLNKGIYPDPIKTIKWNNKYYSKSYSINNITYITTLHPQGKNEEEHTKVLAELMK